MISETSIIYPHVALDPSIEVGEFCHIGIPAKDFDPKTNPTTIGKNSNLRSHTVLYAGNTIGERFMTGHATLIRENNIIGRDVSIGSSSIVEHHVKIGDRVRIHSGAFIPEHSVLEDDVWVGPHVVLTNAAYPSNPQTKHKLVGPTLRAHAKIGANATILPGICVGRYALVGAGSVVTKDVPDYAVVAGNPARVIRDIREIKDYELE